MRAILTVSSYTAGTRGEGIRLYAFDCRNGRFEHQKTILNDKNPSFIAFSRDRKYAYVCQELPYEASIRAYRLEKDGFEWTEQNEICVPGSGMCHITISPGGGHAICSNFTTGNVVSCKICEDGSLGEVECNVQLKDASVRTDWFQDQSRCHQAVFTPDGARVVVANMGGDRLMIYDFDEANGVLQPHLIQHQLVCDPGDGPRHHCFSPNGRMLYSVSEIEAAIVVYRYDCIAGTFERIQKVSTVPADFEGWRTASEIVVDQNNQHLLVSNRGFDTISSFSILSDGRLEETPVYFDSLGQETRMFCLTPDERFAIIANQKSNLLSVCPYEAEAGKLSAPVQMESVHLPAFVDVHPI